MDGLHAEQRQSGASLTAGRPPTAAVADKVLLLAIAGAMAAEPWAGKPNRPTVNATSSAASKDGFAKSATQTPATPSVAKVVRGDLVTHVRTCLPVRPGVLSPSRAVET